MTAATPRLPALPKNQLSEEAVLALRRGFGDATADRFLADTPDGLAIPNALSTMLHHPALAGPFLAYNNVLLFAPALAPRLRELMVLRVAWRTRANYEWVQHVRLAQTCGVTTGEIDAIADAADGGPWTALEATLLTATDQLVDRQRIDDDTWASLAEELEPRQLVEVVFVVGTYVCLAMAFNSFGLELDPELQTVGAPPLPELEE